MRNDIYVDFLPYDFHHAKIVGGYGQNDYAVIVLVGFLHSSRVLSPVLSLRKSRPLRFTLVASSKNSPSPFISTAGNPVVRERSTDINPHTRLLAGLLRCV